MIIFCFFVWNMNHFPPSLLFFRSVENIGTGIRLSFLWLLFDSIFDLTNVPFNAWAETVPNNQPTSKQCITSSTNTTMTRCCSFIVQDAELLSGKGRGVCPTPESCIPTNEPNSCSVDFFPLPSPESLTDLWGVSAQSKPHSATPTATWMSQDSVHSPCSAVNSAVS